MDLSYKLRDAGYRCVYTPHATLCHVGNHSWGAKAKKYKADIFALKRWGNYVSNDEYFSRSMKKVLYQDFTFYYQIHAAHIDRSRVYTGPDVLFFSHELTITGAPKMLAYAATAVQEAGGFSVVIAPADGPLREELERKGVVVIIDASLRDNHFLLERFARNFDIAIVNTIDLAAVVRQLSTIAILNTVWWLHEGKSLPKKMSQEFQIDFERVRLLCVSEYARAFLPAWAHADVLHNGIPDIGAPTTRPTSEHLMTFLLSGTIEPRKGQDIFVDAVSTLPPALRSKCRFLMSGKLWDMHKAYWQTITTKLEKLPEAKYLGPLDHDAQLRQMSEADVIVCCSRDEPFSLVSAEAAMLGKTTILSDQVGIAEILDETSSLKFTSEDAAELSRQMQYAIEERQKIEYMGLEARKKFEKELSILAFNKRFMTYVTDFMASHDRVALTSRTEPGTPHARHH